MSSEFVKESSFIVEPQRNRSLKKSLKKEVRDQNVSPNINLSDAGIVDPKNFTVTKKSFKKPLKKPIVETEKIEPSVSISPEKIDVNKVSLNLKEDPINKISERKNISEESSENVRDNIKTEPIIKKQNKSIDKKTGSKESGVSRDVRERAIEKGLIDRNEHTEHSKYNASTLKEQAKEMANLVESTDIQSIIDVGTGKKQLSELQTNSKIKPATILSYLEDYATKTRNGKLANELVNSPLASEISEMGSGLSLTRIRDKSSASEIIREVNKTRNKQNEKSSLGKSEKVRKDQIKEKLKEKLDSAKKVDGTTWEKFIKEIRC